MILIGSVIMAVRARASGGGDSFEFLGKEKKGVGEGKNSTYSRKLGPVVGLFHFISLCQGGEMMAW